ncbi:FMRFamide peptide receptor frpr-18-like [Lineus longissimus]|uniref:FMRFamide peptide receptor frpr-18-like n=1 Tax=Lineus longissimus TaxID=88925 RepID=UPI00315DA6E2
MGSYHSFVTEDDNVTAADDNTTAILDQDGGTNSPFSVNITESGISPEHQKLFDEIIFATNMIVPPIIISIGIIGNILSFLVLRKKKYAKQSTCVYMRALTFFDSFTLLVYAFQRYLLKLTPDTFWANGDAFCKEFIFVAYLSMSNSHWTLVMMTVDRFIAVRFPLKSVTTCTPRRSKKCILVMAVVATLFNTQQFLRIANPHANVLKFKCPFDYTIVSPAYELIFQHILSYLVFYTPLFSLLILNVLIVYSVTKRGKKSKKLGISDAVRGDSLRRFRRCQDRQITVMLLLVTWVFTIAVTPFTLDHLFWDVIMPHLEDTDPFLRELRHVLYEIALTCIIINPAINFYLYCLGCHKFRNDLKSLFRIMFFRRKDSEMDKGSTQSQHCDSIISTETIETDSVTTTSRL